MVIRERFVDVYRKFCDRINFANQVLHDCPHILVLHMILAVGFLQKVNNFQVCFRQKIEKRFAKFV